MNAPQQEQLRHQYLEAIGISSWLPRTQLPGAAPSPEWVASFTWPALDEGYGEGADSWSESPGAPSAAEQPATAPERITDNAAAARAQARASLGPLSGTPGPAPVAATTAAPEPAGIRPAAARPAPTVGDATTVVAGPRRSQAPAPRVKLAFLLAGDLLIVDSLPPAGRQGFGAPHQRLLQGIARSLGVQERPSDAALLSWPALAGATLDQGPGELSKAVERKLAHTLAVRPVSRALLLGEAAAQWLLGREESLDALRGIRFSLQAGIPCVASASLSEALQLPEVKADLWRDIQPLVTVS